MPGYHYSYLIGTLLFCAAWVVCFIFGKNYRPPLRNPKDVNVGAI